MRHRDHDISLLVPLLNVLESFRGLLQGITSVDDRPELPSRGEFCDETHSLEVVDGHTTLDFLSTGDGGPKVGSFRGLEGSTARCSLRMEWQRLPPRSANPA